MTFFRHHAASSGHSTSNLGHCTVHSSIALSCLSNLALPLEPGIIPLWISAPGSQWPKHTVAQFILALTLPSQIYLFLPFAQELFGHGILPDRSMMLCSSPTQRATFDPNILVPNLLFTYILRL